jgi:RHS repeat-associated protein
LNSVELIHMNGRAFDYNLGRFLSVDPIIQFPTNSQSLNPYSYIMNNPLAGTDPTGFAACGVDDDRSCVEQKGTHKVYDENGKFLGTVTSRHNTLSFEPTSQGMKWVTDNGGRIGIGVTGAGGRKDQQESNSGKGSLISQESDSLSVADDMKGLKPRASEVPRSVVNACKGYVAPPTCGGDQQVDKASVRIPAKADTGSDDGGHPRSVATQAG